MNSVESKIVFRLRSNPDIHNGISFDIFYNRNNIGFLAFRNGTNSDKNAIILYDESWNVIWAVKRDN